MGSSSSKSSSSNTTNTTDKRMVVDNGIGVSSDSSTVTVNALDADIVNKALDTVKASDATNGSGFEGLLKLADKLFTEGGELVKSTQETTLKQIDSINSAAADKSGTIDNKTIMVIAAAGAAAFAFSRKG